MLLDKKNKYLGRLMALLPSWSKDVAIDLGTSHSLVYQQGEGIVIFEPSVVALNKKTGQVLAIGEEARQMIGKTPDHIIASRPLVAGVISDFEVTEQMLRYFLDKVNGNAFFKPRPKVIVGIPCGVTEVEKKAVKDAAKKAGARKVFLIQQPMADAIGAKLKVNKPEGHFIIDIGGGRTEIAVISLGGIVVFTSLKTAGNKLDSDIVQWVQSQFNLLIGQRMAESVKKEVGCAILPAEERKVPIRGRNLVSGLPEEIMISTSEAKQALEKSICEIVQGVKDTIEKTPPEILADIMKNGIYFCGGGSLLSGLPELVQKETKIPTHLVEDPMTAVVRGAGLVLEHMDEYKDVLVETEELEVPR